jgi:type I restriction enzyme S subunit
MKVNQKPFLSVVDDITSKFNKIPKGQYLPEGNFPILDQGAEFVSGYTNDENLITSLKKPALIFGDHTRIFKLADFPFAIGADGVKVLSGKPDQVDQNYLYYVLKSLKIKSAGYSRHFKFLKEKKLPIPEDLDDQKRIAKVLSDCEFLIQKRKDSIALLDELLKSTFLEMFGDESKFESKSIEEIASDEKYSLSSGPFGSNLTSKDYTPDGVIILRGTNVTKGELDLSDIKYVSEQKAKDLERSEIKPDDVVIVAVGSSGTALKIPASLPRAIMSQNFNKVTPNKKMVLPIYLEYSINSEIVQRQFRKIMTNAGRTFLGLTRIREVKIPVPSPEEQRSFEKVVDKIETIKNQLKKSLQELQNLYGSLSQRAFKGELDLSHLGVENEDEDDDYQSIANDLTSELLIEKEDQSKIDERKKAEKEALDSFNNWLASYHKNLPDTGAPAEIDNTIRQLDTELKLKGEIPFWPDYVKYRMVKRVFRQPFLFEELWNEIQKFPFEEKPDYDEVKELVFGWLREENSFLSQQFNEQKRTMELMINEAP